MTQYQIFKRFFGDLDFEFAFSLTPPTSGGFY